MKNKLFPSYQQELDNLRKLSEKYKPSTSGKIAKVFGQVAAGLGTLFIPGLGVARVGIVASALMAGGGIGLSEFLQSDGQLDLDRLEDALTHKQFNLLLGLQNDPVNKLEYMYVLKKRFLENNEPQLIKEIESTLLSLRNPTTGLPSSFINDFLSNALLLPTNLKPLDQYENIAMLHETLEEIEQRHLSSLQKKALKDLKCYDPVTLKHIQRIVTQISTSSVSPYPSYNRFSYFYGGAGIGKSTAARMICFFLGIPFKEITIKSAEDLSQNSFEGGDWMRPNANPGNLTSTLLKGISKKTIKRNFELEIPKLNNPHITIETPNQITYKNSVLIINEFDRILLDPQTSTQTLAFLLDYLDSTKTEFFSPYFKSNVSIKDMHIIITGNNPIPDEKKFEALIDRLDIVHFTGCSANGKKEILLQTIQEMKEKYTLQYLNGENILTEIDIDNTSSIRLLKKRAEQNIIDKKQTQIVKLIRESKQINDEENKEKAKEALYSLGDIYVEGKGVSKNYEKALEYFKKLKDLDFFPAFYRLGRMAEFGQGQPINKIEAVLFYKESIKKNARNKKYAEYRLGLMYEEGRGGLKQDLTEAKRLYGLAAGENHYDAKKRIEFLKNQKN